MHTTRFLAVSSFVCRNCLALLWLVPFCAGQGWVVVPVRDYESLRARAYPPPPEPGQAPAPATLTRIDYDLRVDGTVAAGTAELTIDVLADGWVRLPIPAGLLVRQARAGGDVISLVPGPDARQLAAVLSKKGRSTLILDVAFTVGSAGAEERLSLPAGSSGVTRASVALPQPDVEVKVTGGLPPQLESPQASRWVSFASGAEPLVFIWRKKIEEKRVELPLRMRGSFTQLFGLGEDSTSLNAEARIEVLQGAARQVRIAVPDTVTINQVPGALVADWDVKNGELVVNLLDPVEQATTFTITGETRLAKEGSLAIPLLRLEGVERATGGVAVEVLGAGEIKNSTARGLERAEAEELGPMIAARQSPSLAAFRPRVGSTTGDSPELEVQVVRYAQQAMLTANIEEARYRALMTTDGKILVEARFAVRNNQRDFVKITLPPDAVVWSASVAGKPVRPGEASAGPASPRSILLPLDKNRAGEEAPLFEAGVLYLIRGTEWAGKGQASLPLPALDLPVSRTGVTLYYPPLYRVNAEPGAFRAQPYEAPVSDVLNRGAGSDSPSTLRPSRPAARDEAQALIEGYRARAGAGKPAQAVSVGAAFPAVGPSLFLVAELTGEGSAATIDLNYQKTKDGGAQ